MKLFRILCTVVHYDLEVSEIHVPVLAVLSNKNAPLELYGKTSNYGSEFLCLGAPGLNLTT